MLINKPVIKNVNVLKMTEKNYQKLINHIIQKKNIINRIKELDIRYFNDLLSINKELRILTKIIYLVNFYNKIRH